MTRSGPHVVYGGSEPQQRVSNLSAGWLREGPGLLHQARIITEGPPNVSQPLIY